MSRNILIKLFLSSTFFFSLSACAVSKKNTKAGVSLECKKTDVNGEVKNICFPKGFICKDAHGIGDGKPLVIDCWEGGSRMCNKDSTNWPNCAGGKSL